MKLGLKCVLNVKAVVATFNQEKALVGAFSVITNLRMELFEALLTTPYLTHGGHYLYSRKTPTHDGVC